MDVPQEPDSTPPRPAKCNAVVEQSGEYLDVSYSHRRAGGGCFLLIWLTIWTIGCVVLTGMAIQDPSFQNIAFATPFLASWLFVFCFLVYTLTGKEHLRMTPHGRMALIFS